MESIDIFTKLPADILTTIFMFMTGSPGWWPIYHLVNLKEALRFFRICHRTYNLREYFLHQYATQMAINTTRAMVHIPVSKNIYPYLLLHYFEGKVPRKGRYNYQRFILEFLANKNRQTTVIQYKDPYQYYSILDFCDSHGLN